MLNAQRVNRLLGAALLFGLFVGTPGCTETPSPPMAELGSGPTITAPPDAGTNTLGSTETTVGTTAPSAPETTAGTPQKAVRTVFKPTGTPPVDMTVKSGDRVIDLHPYLGGYKYDKWPRINKYGKVFAKRKMDDGSERLVMLEYDPEKQESIDLDNAVVILDSDLTKRNVWSVFWCPVTERVIIRADENNDEVLAFYEVDPETRTERRLTSLDEVKYIFSHSLSHDGRYVAYATRSDVAEDSRGHIRLLDLKTGQDKILFADTDELKTYWGTVRWRLDDQGVVLTYKHDSERKKANLLYVPIDGTEPTVLTDTSVERNWIYPLEWVDDNQFVFYSDGETGTTGYAVFKYDMRTKEHALLTPGDENVKRAGVIRDSTGLYVVAAMGDPRSSELRFIRADTKEVVYTWPYDGSLYVRTDFGNKIFVGGSHLGVPSEVFGFHMNDGAVKPFKFMDYPQDLLEQTIHCNVEMVVFPTFDKVQVPGLEEGHLYGFLMTPKNPLPKDKQRALVYSFYGGDNYHSNRFQLFCQAGHTVLNPAPRGTDDLGKAFFNVGDGDWGGGETLDAFYAGMFLSEHTGIPPERIGIFGGSRGGYDTLRALTFPGEVNGHSVDFRFGFGISDYGISNVITAALNGNIRGWYKKLTDGNPMLDRKKWLDRSPLYGIEHLDAPVLLTHGINDRRVPYSESLQFVNAADWLGKGGYVTMLTLEGQGHGYSGVEAQFAYYSAVLEWIGNLE